jgi:hypothetical protein
VMPPKIPGPNHGSSERFHAILDSRFCSQIDDAQSALFFDDQELYQKNPTPYRARFLRFDLRVNALSLPAFC